MENAVGKKKKKKHVIDKFGEHCPVIRKYGEKIKGGRKNEMHLT